MATIIGENFPKSRQARKDQLIKIKAGPHISTAKIPGKGICNVYKIPLEYLSYNTYNTRIIAEVKTLEKRFGCKLSDETPLHVKAIEKIIWQQKTDQNETTINSLIKEGQLLPGVVTNNGIILAGNRRFRLLNEINRNSGKYINPRQNIEGLQYFEAVILDKDLTEKEIITYESFYQYGNDDKVDYDPIQKYLAANYQSSIGFKPEEIAQNFSTLTKGGKKEIVNDWLKIFDLMKEYLNHFGEDEIFTSLTSKEEAFINLYKTLKSFTSGRRVKLMWSFDDNDLTDLKLRYFDYIRMGIETHGVRIFSDLFFKESRWKKFNNSVKSIVESKENEIDSFENYRRNYPNDDETTIAKIRINDYKEKFETDLTKIYKIEEKSINDEKIEEGPNVLLRIISDSLDKLESIVKSTAFLNLNNLPSNDPKRGIYTIIKSTEFVNSIRDLQSRIGRMKQDLD